MSFASILLLPDPLLPRNLHIHQQAISGRSALTEYVFYPHSKIYALLRRTYKRINIRMSQWRQCIKNVFRKVAYPPAKSAPISKFTSLGCHNNSICSKKIHSRVSTYTHILGTHSSSKLHIKHAWITTMIMNLSMCTVLPVLTWENLHRLILLQIWRRISNVIGYGCLCSTLLYIFCILQW